jgi:hypothetical protein
MFRLVVVGTLLGGIAAAPVLAQTEAPSAVAGMWIPKETRFVYQGFTAHYSCDGLRDKVRQALLQFGARPDLSVRASACASPAGRPDPFPGVTIKMQVLKPADEQAMLALQTVPARWKSVELKFDRDPLSEAGDCELIEQIKHSLLPLFTTRNVEFSSNCVPHQLSPGGTSLRAELLVSAAAPIAPAPAPAAAAPSAPPAAAAAH